MNWWSTKKSEGASLFCTILVCHAFLALVRGPSPLSLHYKIHESVRFNDSPWLHSNLWQMLQKKRKVYYSSRGRPRPYEKLLTPLVASQRRSGREVPCRLQGTCSRCPRSCRWSSAHRSWAALRRWIRRQWTHRHQQPAGLLIQAARSNFKRLKNREDSSNFDEKNTKLIAVMRSTSGKSFACHSASKNMVSMNVSRELLFEYLSLFSLTDLWRCWNGRSIFSGSR